MSQTSNTSKAELVDHFENTAEAVESIHSEAKEEVAEHADDATDAPVKKVVRKLFWSSSSSSEKVYRSASVLSVPQSVLSVLTRLTEEESEAEKDDDAEAEATCLAMATESNSQMLENIKLIFPQNEDPGIYEYMDIVEVDY